MAIEYVKESYQIQLKPLLMRGVLFFSNKEGIYSRDHHGEEFRCTWREEYDRLCRLANALRNLGVEPGDKVGSFAWNTHRHGELSFAVPMMGSVFHPTNIRYSREHLIYAINHSKDKVMFVDEDLIPLLETIKDEYRGKVTEDDILKPLRSMFPSWWMPDHILFLDELPMTGTMKVMKRVLRDMWQEGKLKV